MDLVLDQSALASGIMWCTWIWFHSAVNNMAVTSESHQNLLKHLLGPWKLERSQPSMLQRQYQSAQMVIYKATHLHHLGLEITKIFQRWGGHAPSRTPPHGHQRHWDKVSSSFITVITFLTVALCLLCTGALCLLCTVALHLLCTVALCLLCTVALYLLSTVACACALLWHCVCFLLWLVPVLYCGIVSAFYCGLCLCSTVALCLLSTVAVYLPSAVAFHFLVHIRLDFLGHFSYGPFMFMHYSYSSFPREIKPAFFWC